MKHVVCVALVAVLGECTAPTVDTGTKRDDVAVESVRSGTSSTASRGFTPDWSTYERWIVRYELDQVVGAAEFAVLRHVPCDWIYVTQEKTPTYVTVEGRSVRPFEGTVHLRHFTRSGHDILGQDPVKGPRRLRPQLYLDKGGYSRWVSNWPAFPLEPGVTVWPHPDGFATQIVIHNFTEYLITTTLDGTTAQGRKFVLFMLMTWQKDKPHWSTMFATGWSGSGVSPRDGEVPYYEKGEVLHWGDGAPPGFYDLPQYPPEVLYPHLTFPPEGDDDGR